MLAFRPQGLFGRAGEPGGPGRRAAAVERGVAARGARRSRSSGRPPFSDYWAHTILIQTFLFGIAAASLIFLSAYGGMVSLAQTALFGIAGFILGNLATQGGPGGTSKGLHLGWDPTSRSWSRSC